MTNNPGGVPSGSGNRVRDPAPLQKLLSLAPFGVLSIFALSAGSANSDTGDIPGADPSALARIGETATCSRYGIDRIVELRVSADQQAPCEVAYLKPDEDQSNTSLWRARNDYGYCALKFSEFISKLENKLLWDCDAEGVSGVVGPTVSTDPSDNNKAKADAVEHAGISEVVETAGEQASEVSAEAADGQATLAAPEPGVESEPGLRRREPALAAAVVSPGLENGGSGFAVSMDDVRSRIPSGPYESIALEGANSSACPPGGSFFWNTRDPEQPVLEMGQDAEFTFSTARGRVGQGFALQAEPALMLERDDSSEYRVASLSVIAAGTVEARVVSGQGNIVAGQGNDEPRSGDAESICQYSLGG